MSTDVPAARFACRVGGFVAVLALGAALALGLGCLRTFAPGRHARWLPGITAWWFVRVAAALDLELAPTGVPIAGPVLIAANHVSWLDVVALGALLGSGFVAKAEVGRWPLIGWLAAQGGALFVSRGERASTDRTAERMTWRLKRGERLAFFPEGTTTDGFGLRPFKSRLFAPAIRLGCPVQPVALRYVGSGGRAATEAAFVGDAAFVPHLWQLLRAPGLRVEVDFRPPLRPVSGEDRRGLALRAEAGVRTALAQAPSAARTVTRPS